MLTRIMHHHHKAWPLPKNRLDSRICPRCAGWVCGSDGQQAHNKDHEREDERDRQFVEAITQICNFLGIKVTIADGDNWAWGAEVEGTEGELESADDRG